MFNTIGEYILTDVFFQLWLVAASNAGKYQNNPQTVVAGSTPQGWCYSRRDWHPALVAQFDDPDDVPSEITVVGATHHINKKGQFHGGNSSPTVSFDEMKIVWGDLDTRDVNNLSKAPNRWRKNGPCSINITNVQKWHVDGQLHRRRGDALICSYAEFFWATKSMKGFYREGGPFKVSMGNVTAKADKGVITEAGQSGPVNYTWQTESGRTIGQHKVDSIIAKTNVQVDFRQSDNVFVRPRDEFLFYAELAKEAA
jgi:hypothetical protein